MKHFKGSPRSCESSYIRNVLQLKILLSSLGYFIGLVQQIRRRSQRLTQGKLEASSTAAQQFQQHRSVSIIVTNEVNTQGRLNFKTLGSRTVAVFCVAGFYITTTFAKG